MDIRNLEVRLLLDRVNAANDPEAIKELDDRLYRKAIMTKAAGTRYKGYTFDNWVPTTDAQTRVKNTVMEWAYTFPERLKLGESLVLYGSVGTGKDHLGFAAASCALMKWGATVDWRNGRDLMSELRDNIAVGGGEWELMHELIQPQLLVISDPLPVLGSLTTYQADALYRIVESRYASGKLTCVIVNAVDDNEADEQIGTATWDRLCDRAWKCRCFWRSYRQPVRVDG